MSKDKGGDKNDKGESKEKGKGSNGNNKVSIAG